MKRAIFGGWVVLLVLVNLPVARAETPADPAEWVPDDVLVYVGVTDVERTWEDFKATAGYKLMSDPLLAKAGGQMGMLGAVIEDVKTRLAKALDVEPDALKSPFKGPLAFFVTGRPGTGPDQIQPGLVAGVGDEATLKQYLDKLAEKLKDSHEHKEASAGEATIHVFAAREDAASKSEEKDEFADFDKEPPSMTPSPEKLIKDALDQAFAGDALPKQFAYSLSGGRLVLAGNEEQVQKLLGKQGSSLADTDDHRALLNNLKPVGTVRILGNLPRIIELEKAEAPASAKEWLRVLGVESLRSVVGHLRLGASSYDGKFELLFLMRGERSGLAKILSMDNAPTAPPAFISADTWMYMGLNLNVAALVEQIERMVSQGDAAAGEQMKAFLDAAPLGTPEPVNLRKELLEHLQGPLCADFTVTKPYGPDTTRMMVTLGHRNAAAVAKFLEYFAGMLTPREAEGTRIFDIMMPIPGLAGNSIAVGADRIVIGKSETIEQTLAAAGAPLAATSEFQRAARFVPEQAWMVLYTDGRRIMEAALELAKQGAGQSMDPAVMMLTSSLSNVLSEPDKVTPEQAQKLLDHQSSMIMTITTTPDGVQLTMVTLRPAEQTSP